MGQSILIFKEEVPEHRLARIVKNNFEPTGVGAFRCGDQIIVVSEGPKSCQCNIGSIPTDDFLFENLAGIWMGRRKLSV